MYIRTKDGVYEVEKEEFGLYCCKGLEMAVAPYDEEILKQSENLEELIDDFVIDWLPTNHKDIFKVDKYSKEVVKSCIGNNKTKVYGAIWTPKGLIFVAIMNENGDLEFIEA